MSGLSAQEGDFEVLMLGQGERNPLQASPLAEQCRWISVSERGFAALNLGAATAQGDILLFLHPHNQLATNALAAISHNLQLLPQTIGGNFHQKFEAPSFQVKVIARILKKLRYNGCYYDGSGVFVRKDVFAALKGFNLAHPLPDFAFVQGMERYGPTLYLPEIILAPPPSAREALTWLMAPMLGKYQITWPLLKIIKVNRYAS